MTEKTRDIMQEANLISRMERLPLSKPLYIILAILATIWVIEAFDVGIITSIMAPLTKLWSLTPAEVGRLGSCSTAGIVIGTACAGFLTDKFGRKRVLIFGTLIFTFFTMIGALFSSYKWVVVMRFISGLGGGAVFPQPTLMISEIAPAKYRGRLVGICNSMLTFAFMLPALIGSWALNHFAVDIAWRIPFIIGGTPIILVFFMYKWIPESPRWLMKHGRYDEVRTLVERFEKSGGITPDTTYIDPQILDNLKQTSEDEKKRGKTSWTMLFRPPYLSRTLVTWGLYTAGLINWYVIMVYLPTIISTFGIEVSQSIMITGVLIFIAGFGGIAIGPIADKYGRKPTFAVFLGITILAFALVPSAFELKAILLLLGSVITFFSIGANSIIKVYITEQYPTELRGVGAGFAEAFARFFGGVLATYYLAFFLATGGVAGVFYFLAATYAVALISTLIFGRETAGRSVEEVSAENN